MTWGARCVAGVLIPVELRGGVPRGTDCGVHCTPTPRERDAGRHG